VTGRILQINVSPGGLPKRPVPHASITPLGIEGDAHSHAEIHGGPRQAVLLLAAETVDDLIAREYPVFYGALGENLTMQGLDRRLLRVGQQLRAGSAILEITKVRVPCGTLDVYGPTIKNEIYDQRVKAGDPTSVRWGMSGFYCAVIQTGEVFTGDPISIESVLA
jgi:MOSC domain-containing protein YiiM